MNNSHISKFAKKRNNNERVFSSLDKEIVRDVDVNKEINDIFKSSDFVYKADVIIYTKDGSNNKRIIGRNKDYLITDNNELISIKDIIDIKKTG